ncbi:hypothetical protein Tco_0577896 [Tanacetum coccineum]
MPEFQDTAGSKKQEAKIFTFYRNEGEGERYFAPCYIGGLHAYDVEINLGYEKNVISNEFAVKLCLEYEEKNGEKLVNRELLVSLKGEFYFIKFKINQKEEDVEPNMILGRSFVRLAKGIVASDDLRDELSVTFGLSELKEGKILEDDGDEIKLWNEVLAKKVKCLVKGYDWMQGLGINEDDHRSLVLVAELISRSNIESGKGRFNLVSELPSKRSRFLMCVFKL